VESSRSRSSSSNDDDGECTYSTQGAAGQGGGRCCFKRRDPSFLPSLFFSFIFIHVLSEITTRGSGGTITSTSSTTTTTTSSTSSSDDKICI